MTSAHPSTRKAGADIDVARTTLQFVRDTRELIAQLKREGAMSPRARMDTLQGLCASAEECSARLMLRNGLGLVQAELELGAESARSSQPLEQVKI